MKMEISLALVILFCLCHFSQCAEDIIYDVDKVLNFLDLDGLDNEEYQQILQNISKIFENSYTFNDIAKNPPQPSFNKSYYTVVDIQERLKNLNIKDINIYQFYQRINNVLSDLKDFHIRLFFRDSYIEYFYLIAPFDYYIKEYNGKQRIFSKCINENYLKYFKDYENLYKFCQNYYLFPVKTINGKDPFEYINNFGGNYASTKNSHGTFTYKMNYNNDICLSDYPLTKEEMGELKVVFENETDSFTINTEYKIHSDEIDIDKEIESLRRLGEGRRVRSKYYSKNRKNMEKDRERREKKKSKKSKFFNEDKLKRNLEEVKVIWNYNAENDFMCYVDEVNKINYYYVGSFEPEDRNNFKKVIKDCVEIIDKNTYPIVVVNELNEGGYISLAQLFMGVLSPLMPIDLFKGRLRVTESLKESNGINSYINSNFTSINTCQKQNFADLLTDSVKPNYCENKLSKMFYINNATLHDEIENIRKNMKNKRKPTEILVLTDGFSFSAAAFYIKYLQKMGGAIVAGYMGNPYSKEIFDSSQSPSPIFTAGLLNEFNSEEIKYLYNEYNIIMEFPGIQSFYGLDDKDVPLEYDVTPVDVRLNLYDEFNQTYYQNFTDKSKSILNDIKNKCYSSNKNLILLSDECDSSFKNNYTHGGYICKDDGTWSKENCVAAYCDLGYSFDKNKRKCIKDVCSSIPIPDIEDDIEEETPSDKKDPDDGKSSTTLVIVIIVIIVVLILIIVLVVFFLKKKRLHSENVEYNKEINDIIN